jgi:hypothetical protein
MTMLTGIVYEGDFEDGRFDGKGKMTNANGIILHEGDWVNGEPA